MARYSRVSEGDFSNRKGGFEKPHFTYQYGVWCNSWTRNFPHEWYEILDKRMNRSNNYGNMIERKEK